MVIGLAITTDIYVSSTSKKPSYRLHDHKLKASTRNSSFYKRMREVGVKNWRMIPLITFFCDQKTIFEFENTWICALNADLNEHKAFRTNEEKFEQKRKATRKYREGNKEKINSKCREYCHNHPERVKESCRKYGENSRDELNKRKRENNREKVECESCMLEVTATNLRRHQRGEICKASEVIV